ncbi:MAG: ligand-gated channel [Nitrospirales bacterium]|nr:MAG: ligand-gated channel [Nitrospirales bacterium]
MNLEKWKRVKKNNSRQATPTRVREAFLKAAFSVNEYHRHRMVWGAMIGLSSLAVGTYHPALAQGGQALPQPGQFRHQDSELTSSGRHHTELAARQDGSDPMRKSMLIPAGDLQSALLALSDQGGVELLYPAALVAGLQTKGLEGLYSSEEALQKVLKGTGLNYRFSNANTVTLFAQTDTGAAGAAVAGASSASDIPVVEVQPVEVTDTITHSKVFLPPVDGYKADEAIGSTRTALPITETPTSIGVVTRDIIKDTYSRTQNDAFEHVSGVSRANTSRGGRTEAFNIRGFSGSDREGSFGAIRSNGLPTGASFAPDPALVERYEIIKGPASIAGGASSPGGFVNRITKRPEDVNFATSDFQAGSFDLYRGVVDANGVLPLHENVRGRLIFAVEEGGHFVDDIDVRQYTVAPSLEIDLFGGAGTLLLTGHYQNFDGSNTPGFPLLENGEVPDIRRTRSIGGGSSNGAKFTFEQQNYELHYNHEFVNNLTLSVRGKYAKSDQSDKYIYAYGNTPLSGVTPIYGALRTIDWETYAGEIFLSQEFDMLGQKHEVLIGVDHRDQTQDVTVGYASLGVDNIFNPANNFQLPSDAVLNANPFATSPRTSKIKQTGLFGQAVFRPIEPLTLVAAGRYDWAEASRDTPLARSNGSENYSEFTGRVGATYALLPDLRVYAGYSQSFQVNISSTTVDGALVPPETGESYEVGAKLDLLDGRLRLTTALFRSYRQNVATLDPNNPLFSIAVGEQRHQGVEFDVNGQPWPGLNMTANVAYIDAEITEDNIGGRVGETPTLIPRSYIGKVFVTYELQSGLMQGLGFGGGVFFQSGYELQLPNGFKTDGYERVDAVVFYRPPRKAYDFTINVRNLLDATYIESPSALDFGNQFGAPVSVFGTLRVKFSPDLDWSLW